MKIEKGMLVILVDPFPPFMEYNSFLGIIRAEVAEGIWGIELERRFGDGEGKLCHLCEQEFLPLIKIPSEDKELSPKGVLVKYLPEIMANLARMVLQRNDGLPHFCQPPKKS